MDVREALRGITGTLSAFMDDLQRAGSLDEINLAASAALVGLVDLLKPLEVLAGLQ